MGRRARSRAQQQRLKNMRSAAPASTNDDQRTWYRMKNFVDQPDTAAIYLYGEIGYWGVEAQDFVRDLMGLRVSNIIVHINSPGGEVFDGLAIYHALRDHPANVECRVDGLAASAASFIAMAGNKVVMQRNAQMMIHDASGIEIGNAEDMRTMADLLDMCSDNIADIYAQQGGGTVEQWRAAMKVETWYSAAEAHTAGLCDEVANADDETGEDEAVVPGEEEADALMDKTWDLSLFAFKHEGRDQAPAPAPLAELAPAEEPVEEPAVEASAEPVVEPAPPVDDVAETPAAVEPEPADDAPPETPAETPLAIAAPLAIGDHPTDSWTALTSGLLEPEPTASTVDELFAALLQQKGTPA
jgi:ATP-dependent Clp endopeptidase proteolytic subunit ClpP